MALATPRAEFKVCSGECTGIIAFEPKGDLGFGYDPIFYLPDLGKMMAELPTEIKNRISHRGKAARKAIRLLERPPFSTFYDKKD